MNQYTTRPPNALPIDPRNGGRVNGRPNEEAESNQSRAARFEDEKRRIVDSCFAKRDPDGTQLESYITHVRVIEDASYPSSPPPPESAPNDKKSRVILMAVRRSGKVRIHKARENPSGTFSIGKTWNLDELTAIQSYTAFMPGNQQEAFEKSWAGNTGFIVSLGKPYYWQAPTSKEKDFYIASLIKIFRKYTGGKLPQLIGFPARDLEMLGAASPVPEGRQTPVMTMKTPPVSQTTLPGPPPVPDTASPRPQSPYSARAPSGGTNRSGSQDHGAYGQNEYRPMTREGQRLPPEDASRSPQRFPAHPAPSEDSSRSVSDRPEYRDPYASRAPPQQDFLQARPSRPSISPKSSQSSLPRAETAVSVPKQNGAANSAFAQFQSARRNLAPARSQESVAADGDYSTPSRPAKSPEPPPPIPRVEDEAPPERRRPPMTQNQFSFEEELSVQKTSNTAFYTPSETPMRPSENSTPSQTPKIAPTKPPQEYFSVNTTAASKNATEPSSRFGAATDPTPPAPSEPDQLTPISLPADTSDDKDQEQPKKDDDEYRPGLGPMLKKKSGKDIANQFRKAALAASAFQPRQGGAGARLKAMQEKTSNEPDGITGVVPAPVLRGLSTDSAASMPGVASPGLEKERPLTPLSTNVVPKVQIQRTATEDSISSVKVTNQQHKAAEQRKEETRPTSPDKPRSRSPQRKRRQRQEGEIAKFCSSLALDPRIMEGRGADFNELLTEFGWDGKLPERQKIETFESYIRREIGRAQATGWLGHIEQQEYRVQDLARAFDMAITECEEMDGLLTLYSHELDTLHEDIEYIEAQSQGLQVQTANQKLLQGELQGLLTTLSISSTDLMPLQSAHLEDHNGMRSVEKALILLYRAMITIDPEIRQNQLRQATATKNDRTGVGVYADTEIGQMRAVRQKKDEYREAASLFVRRFNQHMTSMFKSVEESSSDDNPRSLVSTSSVSLLLPGLQKSRAQLWSYGPMVLFVREVNPYEWQTLVSSYEISIKTTYREQFRDYIVNQRRSARQPTGEEQELLFTHQEKEKAEESITSTATRKLTVKRGKTVKTTALRQAGGASRGDGKPEAWEVFDTVLQEQSKKISEEQNFVVHFFHLNSQSNIDFVDIVSSRTPELRTLPNLETPLPYDPDADMSKKVLQAMEGLFAFWATDLQSLVDWVLRTDHLQGVGVLCALEKCQATYEETNQQHIARTVRALSERLTGLFKKFVDDQVKAIEETKVKVNKRKGIISFMRTFPAFSSAVESMMPHEIAHNETFAIRFVLDDAYAKILKAMWESLNFIAKDNPASGSGGAQGSAPTGGDPEDKEALNYHILLIENMNHFVEEVDVHKINVLDEWKERALHDMYKHLTQYLDAVIRRPMGKWLDFLESTEALMKANERYSAIASRPSHSRSSAKKVLAHYDSKEVRKGVETLKKRVEKHFGDVDDPSNTSKSLISRVFDECAARYAHSHERMKAVVDSVYDGNLEIEWRKEEVSALFKR